MAFLIAMGGLSRRRARPACSEPGAHGLGLLPTFASDAYRWADWGGEGEEKRRGEGGGGASGGGLVLSCTSTNLQLIEDHQL